VIAIPGVRHTLEKLCSISSASQHGAYYKAGRPEGFYDSAEAARNDAETAERYLR